MIIFKHKYLLLIFAIIVCQAKQLEAEVSSLVVDNLTTFVDGNASPYNQLGPGDTLFILSGTRDFLQIKNLTGTAAGPIIIINKGGVVSIDAFNYYGISIQNCRYFRLTGTGSIGNFYGIKIIYVSGGAGLGIGGMSSDYEVDHISIENTFIGGFYGKTDPDCTFAATRDNFTQFNTRIHDNYIANVANEGMYIGSTKYHGQTVNCNGHDTLLLPHVLEGVWVYNNIINHVGWDGIQVSSSVSDCHVFGNLVLYDSQEESVGQMSGISLGGGSKCDCYNNYISQGKGNGIESHGLGGYRIFNNIIVDAGRTFQPGDTTLMKHGIYVSDVSVEADSSFYILYNDIINPKSDGIRFNSMISRNNLIASNLIVNPGNYDYYENGNTSFTGNDAYIMIPDTISQVDLQHNFLTRYLDSALVSPVDYTILPGSPLIDAAFSNSVGITFDYYHHLRPFGITNDIGAFEFDPAVVGIKPGLLLQTRQAVVFPNPVKTVLTIKYQSEFAAPVILSVFNLQGNLLLQNQRNNMPGEVQQIQIDVGTLSPGLYLYQLRNNDQLSSGRFIKIR
ncbi:MAG: T9SS type A sorting domain-containing protein [Bacteroidota bacterium]